MRALVGAEPGDEAHEVFLGHSGAAGARAGGAAADVEKNRAPCTGLGRVGVVADFHEPAVREIAVPHLLFLEPRRRVRGIDGDVPAWFEKQKMRHGDFAYRWLVEIRHNSDPPAPDAGSAIFFHIRRGATRPTAGCTTMAEENLVKLIRTRRADARPHYALLPRSEYEAKWKAWGLPSPAEAAALLP